MSQQTRDYIYQAARRHPDPYRCHIGECDDCDADAEAAERDEISQAEKDQWLS